MKNTYKNFVIVTSALLTILNAGSFELVELGNLTFENGVTLDCKIEIRTFGALNGDSSNIVVVPTAFGQTTKDIARLVAPGKLADSTKFFVVLIGALGNGVSSSPSNQKMPAGEKFPNFSIRDMVTTQHNILTNYLKFKNIYAFVGGSMGGMQIYEWLVTHPDYMKKAVIYVSTPVLSASDFLSLSTSKEIIDNGWAGGQSDEEIYRSLSLLSAMNSRSPDFWTRTVSLDSMKIQIEKIQTRYLKRFNSRNHHSQVTAILTHDVTRKFNRSLENAAGVIGAELLIIMSQQDHSVHPEPSKRLAKMLGAETLLLDNDCGHYAPSCEKPLFYKTINTFLSQ